MQLDYGQEFQEVREQWAKFWAEEASEPMLYSITPKDGVTPVSRPRPYDCAFGDIDPIIDQALGWVETHEFLGGAIPNFMITFAPDHFAALLGAEIKRSEEGNTNWVEPCLKTLEDAEISFSKDNHWWKRTVECVERFRAKCDGKLIISGTHFQGSLDCLVAMYGTQELLLDMSLKPDVVKDALKQVDKAYAEARKALSDILDVDVWGSINRFGMYSSGIIDVPQCDLSCMVSAEMFDDFELPFLRREIELMDASIYHLDGPDALQHTESLCAIDNLDMIQWMPGEGYYDDDWSELNAQIDSLSKGQIFQGYYNLTAEDIEKIWNKFGSRKLFFHVSPEVFRELR